MPSVAITSVGGHLERMGHDPTRRAAPRGAPDDEVEIPAVGTDGRQPVPGGRRPVRERRSSPPRSCEGEHPDDVLRPTIEGVPAITREVRAPADPDLEARARRSRVLLPGVGAGPEVAHEDKVVHAVVDGHLSTVTGCLCPPRAPTASCGEQVAAASCGRDVCAVSRNNCGRARSRQTLQTGAVAGCGCGGRGRGAADARGWGGGQAPAARRTGGAGARGTENGAGLSARPRQLQRPLAWPRAFEWLPTDSRTFVCAIEQGPSNSCRETWFQAPDAA